MSIFGGSGIGLSAHPGPLPAGARFGVRVDVPEVDEKVRSGTVELGHESTYRETYEDDCTLGESCSRYRREGHLGGSGRSHSHSESRVTTSWSALTSFDLFAGPPAPVSRVFDFELPDDASPCVDGILSWQVRAEVERERGRDLTEQLALRVVGTPQQVTVCQHENPGYRGVNPMTVSLAQNRFHGGGWVVGTVTVQPTVPLQTRGLRAQLTRIVAESYTGERDATVEQQVLITGPFGYLPGQPFQVPFRIPFPAAPSPCCDGRGRSQHWYLEIVADVPFGEDELIRMPLALT